MTKEVIVTAPKPGQKIASAGRAPVLIAAEEAEAARKAAEAEAEAAHQLADDQARAEDLRRKEEAEQADADQRSVADTQAIPSTNPPPPTAGPSEAQLNEYLAVMDKEKSAKAERTEAVTGDMLIVVIPPPAVSVPPDPPQWGRSQPRVAMPAVTEKQVRFSENLPRIVFGTLVLFAAVLGIVFIVGVYHEALPMPSFDTLVGIVNPTTHAPIAPTPLVTIAITVPNPEPIPHGLLPLGAEPGLQGARGNHVRMSARAAFPMSCATAWGVRRTDGVLYVCGRDQRRGNNLCGCDVMGLVP